MRGRVEVSTFNFNKFCSCVVKNILAGTPQGLGEWNEKFYYLPEALSHPAVIRVFYFENSKDLPFSVDSI